MASAFGLALVAGSAVAQDLAFPIDGDSRFNWQSYHDFADKYDLTGQTLTIFGPWTREDKVGWEKVIAYFAAATGATVENSGSESFEQQMRKTMELPSLTFVSADVQQRETAAAEGLPVEDPNQHR